MIWRMLQGRSWRRCGGRGMRQSKRERVPVKSVIAALVTSLCANSAWADDSTLGMFREACWPAQVSFDASDGAIRRAGWSVVEENSHPALTRLMALSRTTRSTGTIHQTQIYGRADRAMTFVVLTELTPADARLLICHLYVFDAASPTPERDLEQWLGEPTRSDDSFGMRQHSRQHWSPPPNFPGVLSVWRTFASPDLAGGGGEHLRVTWIAQRDDAVAAPASPRSQ